MRLIVCIININHAQGDYPREGGGSSIGNYQTGSREEFGKMGA
jgi:hypothetical protein